MYFPARHREAFSLEKRNDSTHAALHACEMTVAIAAPLTPHPENEDEKRVEDDIEECPDHYGPHGNPRASLDIDECVQSGRYLHETRPDKVYRKIVLGIADCIGGGPREKQDRLHEDICQGGSYGCKCNQQDKAVAENPFSPVPVSLAECDCRKRGTASSYY